MNEIIAICINSCKIGGHTFEKERIYETENYFGFDGNIGVYLFSGEVVRICEGNDHFTYVVNPMPELKAAIEQLYKNNRPE